MFFPQNVVIFLNSASSAAALVFYLPGVCTHTDTEGKQRKARVRNILKSSEKNTIFNEYPVSIFISFNTPSLCKFITFYPDKGCYRGGEQEDARENPRGK